MGARLGLDRTRAKMQIAPWINSCSHGIAPNQHIHYSQRSKDHENVEDDCHVDSLGWCKLTHIFLTCWRQWSAIQRHELSKTFKQALRQSQFDLICIPSPTWNVVDATADSCLVFIEWRDDWSSHRQTCNDWLIDSLDGWVIFQTVSRIAWLTQPRSYDRPKANWRWSD